MKLTTIAALMLVLIAFGALAQNISAEPATSATSTLNRIDFEESEPRANQVPVQELPPFMQSLRVL